MSPAVKGFAIQVSILTIVVGAINFGIFHFAFRDHYSQAVGLIPAFFWLLTIVVFASLTKVGEGRPQRFVSAFMGITLAKMLFSGLILVVCGIIYRQDAIPFFISFLVMYLIYTAFEVRGLLKHFRKQDSSSEDSA